MQEKWDLLGALNNNNGISLCNGQEQGKGSTTLLSDTDRPAYVRYGVVPLESVEIREFRDPFTDEVDDIAYAFSQTLTRLKADASPFITQLSQSIHFGRGWIQLPPPQTPLPQCQKFPPNYRMQLTFHVYQCQDLREPWLPSLLYQLKTMILIGSAALTFHPDTLHTTSNITYLHLSTYMEHNQCLFYPSTNPTGLMALPLPSRTTRQQEQDHQRRRSSFARIGRGTGTSCT